jgi:hypothetical protein
VLNQRIFLSEFEKKLYLNAVTEINSRTDNLLNENLGNQFIQSCGKDIAGEVVRSYFNTNDYYITVDQLAMRILNFNYKNEYDPLNEIEANKKSVLNYNDTNFMESIKVISNRNNLNEVKLSLDRYVTESKTSISNNLKKYINPGSDSYKDELTGIASSKSSLDGDHIVPISDAKINERYTNVNKNTIKSMQDAYNSRENIQYINNSANRSKNNAETPNETIKKWENAPEEVKNNMKGYFDKDGKVKPQIKNKLENNYNQSLRKLNKKLDKIQLKNTKYNKVAEDAALQGAKSTHKILAGQSHDHHFKWWFEISPIRAEYLHA